MFDYTYNGYLGEQWTCEYNTSTSTYNCTDGKTYDSNYCWEDETVGNIVKYYCDKTFQFEGIGTTDGIYEMEDDFGTSYYFRGSRSLNNVVKYGTYETDMYYYRTAITVYSTGSLAQCQAEAVNVTRDCVVGNKYASAGDSMYWRIVRINGDGTLRLMYIGNSATATGINSIAGLTTFNAERNDPKYSGYTYDNSTPDAGDGTASSMKNYLETWYTRSMSAEDANIGANQFYGDTTGYAKDDVLSEDWGGDIFSYTTTKRLAKNYFKIANTVYPKLKTENTTLTYGGKYNLKVGLLNIDEIVISGHDGIYGSFDYGDATTYPYTINTDFLQWAFSPASCTDGSAEVFGTFADGRVDSPDVSYNGAVAPVINLSTDFLKQLIGTGSTTDPYRAP